MKIYTKTGDDGETGLFFGGRVRKNDLHCESYGAIDQAVAAMGLGRALSSDEEVRSVLLGVQNQMFTVGAELATLGENYPQMRKHYKTISAGMTMSLEGLIDKLSEEIDLPDQFIVPGATKGSAALDLARSTIRFAERRIIDLEEAGRVMNKEILIFINRLSDLMFILARYEDRNVPVEVITGQRINE